MSWNAYPTNIVNFLIRKLKTKYYDPAQQNDLNDESLLKICFLIPYLGRQGEFLINSCVKNIRGCLSQPVKFIVLYHTKKVSYFTSNNEKIPELARSNVVYKISYAGFCKR